MQTSALSRTVRVRPERSKDSWENQAHKPEDDAALFYTQNMHFFQRMILKLTGIWTRANSDDDRIENEWYGKKEISFWMAFLHHNRHAYHLRKPLHMIFWFPTMGYCFYSILSPPGKRWTNAALLTPPLSIVFIGTAGSFVKIPRPFRLSLNYKL